MVCYLTTLPFQTNPNTHSSQVFILGVNFSGGMPVKVPSFIRETTTPEPAPTNAHS